jgi:hypothetical protein
VSGFELRPLTLGELLDRAFLVYRRNFSLFAGIMVIPACALIPARFFLLRTRDVPFPWNKASPTPHMAAYTIALLFLDCILYAVAQGATTYAVADAYLGHVSTVRSAYGKIRRHFWRIMGLTFNVGIRVSGLMVILVFASAAAGGALAGVISRSRMPSPFDALIVVGLVLAGFALTIVFSTRYALSLPAVLLENIKGGAAIRRSVLLSKGRRGQIFLAILLGVVVLYAMAIIFQGPFYAGIALAGIKGQLPGWLILAMSVSGAIGGVIASPLLMIVLVLFYYDLRIRKEGFDLQYMMTSLPEPNPAAFFTPR